MSYRPRLVVMLKEPRAGRVKTRLGKDIGMTAAARWFRHQSLSLLKRLESPKWDLVLAVSPDHQGMKSRVWPRHLPRVPQGRGDLGDRMGGLFHVMPHGPVCIIGADIPGIKKRHIESAFGALGNHDAVFGPAVDGGYWLVGMKRTAAIPSNLFNGVRWSTQHAMADSMATMPGLSIATVATLRDVDVLDDLYRLKQG